MDKPITKKREKIVIDELLTRQVAACAIRGANLSEIAQELKLSREITRKILNSSDCRSLIRQIGEDSLQTAKAIIRKETSELAKKVIAVINKHLDEDNLDAVKVALKVIGFNDQEQAPKGDTSVTVVMPNIGKPEPKDIIDVSS